MSDIDRLIELGLNRYGAGDLDGALLFWEEALAIDPDNAQATSYVDYVRLNYDLLATGEPNVEDAGEAPFAIEEEPEYVIEVIPGRPSDPAVALADAGITLPPAAALVSLDPVDEGWDIEETHDATFRANDPGWPDHDPASSAMHDSDATGQSMRAPEGAFELPDEAELELELVPTQSEPPRTIEIEADEPPLPAPPAEVNFEDATREYHGVAQAIARPILPLPSELSAPEPHRDFQQEEHTGGFNPQGTPVGFSMQETEVRKRDFGFVQPAAPPKPVTDTPSSPMSIGTASTIELHEATQERASRFEDATSDDEDKTNALPTRPTEPESGEIILPSKAATREMPEPSRSPARFDSSALSQAEVMLPHAPTRELTPTELRRANDPVLSAPTRELGLRPGSIADSDDAPTGQTDVRKIREAAARRDGAAPARPGTEGTRHDIVLPFDPIAAQSAQILDDVDADAPAGESKEDATRRRTTRLLELAAQWSKSGDLDKAVSAVDLAMSEDPNSALGQKLITRNKDTIMSLFQAFLGDLERTPQLAKPLHELANAPISPRAAFLLSRIDGMLTIDELLDVSGMPRLEAYRHLCQLFLRGILR